MKSFKLKSLVILILFFVFTHEINAFSKNILYPQIDTVVEITPLGSRVFLIGIRNQVKVTVKGVKNKNIEVTGINARVQKGPDDLYFVYPKKWGNLTLQVSVDGRIIKQKTFRCKSIPAPHSYVIGFPDKYTLSKSEILKAGGIEASQLCTIKSFSLSVSGSGKTIKQNNGGAFSKEQIELIEKAKRGQYIYLGDIVGSDVNGGRRFFSTFKIQIK